ncbi:hypothetical protein K469DRAFT_560380 [Zopfia rhizophila CBS 207.26]|uniref:Uncharacterized protein n=1 Tax=Zopfia rhizophila CBS 207.26 TaxID=1314779 RepID=A0A6A6EJN0_9PEZI|nr:hypothetical protein K469DRAFT_560380 [Zopfia rhizophila CBS 207.26]
MDLLNASIEISTAPEDVREKFLDFSQIPTYHPNGFFKSLGPAIPNKPLEPGDKMHNVLEGMTFDPIFLENSPTCFRWLGSLPGIFSGEHIFRFEPSIATHGGTTFVQEEKFTGILAFLMGDGFVARSIGLREKTKRGWESYNRDLKTWCERSKKGN